MGLRTIAYHTYTILSANYLNFLGDHHSTALSSYQEIAVLNKNYNSLLNRIKNQTIGQKIINKKGPYLYYYVIQIT